MGEAQLFLVINGYVSKLTAKTGAVWQYYQIAVVMPKADRFDIFNNTNILIKNKYAGLY
jgi:hypothetical protein